VDAHLHSGIDERIQRALDRRALALSVVSAATSIGIGFLVGLGSVQRKDCTQVLCVREERLWRYE
jgi:hypothetical protein